MGRPAVFFDRDGVINRAIVVNGKPFAPVKRSEFELIDGVGLSLTRLRKMGFVNVVITNQPDLSTGKQTASDLDSTHIWMLETLDLDAIFVCPHLRTDSCYCRKPKPGLLEQARERFGIDYGRSFLVGDRWSDIEVGQVVGLRANFFIDYGYFEPKPIGAFETVKSLHEATERIIQMTEKT
jgi:D-glycero-D-manno-heptose 1,7-bisphosphate phosphatase